MAARASSDCPRRQVTTCPREPYRPSGRVSRASGPDPSRSSPGAPRSSGELLGALPSSPILEHANLLEAFEA
eukprot:15440815-Alexandrium_andersonii.AAC.1